MVTTYERNHDLRDWVEAFLAELDSCTNDGASLHLCDLRISDTETAATVTEHWVVFRERSNASLDLIDCHAHCSSHFLLTLLIVWYELMERWVEKTDVDSKTVHCLQDAIEVSLLIREELCKSLLTTFDSL